MKLNVKHIFPIIGTLSEYSVPKLKDDLVAGVIIAALTIPLSMGYAEVAGVPPVYGLYAAILTATIFALLTKTKNVVFGMDSATAAVTGSAMALFGVVLGTEDAIGEMVFLSIATSIFVLIFFFLKLGRFAEKIPAPVMHGFILGISCVVIVGQIPKLLGIQVAGMSAIDKVVGIFSNITVFSPAVLIMSAIAIAAIVFLGKRFPKLPSAILVLIACSIVSWLLAHFELASFPTIGAIDGGLPSIVLIEIPHGDFLQHLGILGNAFAVALVLSIESMLCFKALNDDTSSSSESDSEHAQDSASMLNRELGVAGLANCIAACFACPPAASSLSRTAAAKDAGGQTQVASFIGAAIVLLSVLVLAPVIAFVPQAVLGAIVVCAMAKLPNFKELWRYAQHMKVELAIVLVVAAFVFVFGAVYGVFFGVVASWLSYKFRKKGVRTRKAVFGVVDIDADSKIDKAISKMSKTEKSELLKYVKMTFGSRLHFSNATDKMNKASEILADIPADVPLVLGLSKLRIVDASANDAILELVSNEQAKGRRVYCIRKLALANDSYTRYELRRVFSESDGVFPSKKAFERELIAEKLTFDIDEKVTKFAYDSNNMSFDITSEKFTLPAEPPVITLFTASDDKKARGRLIYVKAKETIRFRATLEEKNNGAVLVSDITMYRRRTKEPLGNYKDGRWITASMNNEELDVIFRTINTAVTFPVFLEEFDGIDIEDEQGNEFEL